MNVVKAFKIVQFGVTLCSCERRLSCTLNSYGCHTVHIEVGNNEILFCFNKKLCNFFSSVPFFVWRHTAVSFYIVCNNTRLPLLIHKDIWFGFVWEFDRFIFQFHKSSCIMMMGKDLWGFFIDVKNSIMFSVCSCTIQHAED